MNNAATTNTKKMSFIGLPDRKNRTSTKSIDKCYLIFIQLILTAIIVNPFI